MKPQASEQEIAKSERRMRAATAVSLVSGIGLTTSGRRRESVRLRRAGKTVVFFSLYIAATLAFLAFVSRHDKQQMQEEAEARRFEEARTRHAE